MTEGYWKWMSNGLTRFLKVPFFRGMIVLTLIYAPIIYLIHDDLLIHISIVIYAIIGFLILTYQIHFENRKKNEIK